MLKTNEIYSIKYAYKKNLYNICATLRKINTIMLKAIMYLHK